MSLYSDWQELSSKERTQEEYNQFWGEYLPKEQSLYEKILSDSPNVIRGSLSSLAESFSMTEVVFAGFMDGVNTSLKEETNLEELTEDSQIALDIEPEKLYFNMLAAKAEWLYGLPQWDAVLSDEKRKAIKKEYNKTQTVVKDKKIGRNEPCPCGSGKKYKQCCLNK